MTDSTAARSVLDDCLDEIETFLEDQQDVVDGSDGPKPNRAMLLLSELQVCRAAAQFAPAREAVLSAALGEATSIGMSIMGAYVGIYESYNAHKRRLFDRLQELSALSSPAQGEQPLATGGGMGCMPSAIAGPAKDAAGRGLSSTEQSVREQPERGSAPSAPSEFEREIARCRFTLTNAYGAQCETHGQLCPRIRPRLFEGAPSERPTPETNHALVRGRFFRDGWYGERADYVPADTARRLERERDAAREGKWLTVARESAPKVSERAVRLAQHWKDGAVLTGAQFSFVRDELLRLDAALTGRKG